MCLFFSSFFSLFRNEKEAREKEGFFVLFQCARGSFLIGRKKNAVLGVSKQKHKKKVFFFFFETNFVVPPVFW